MLIPTQESPRIVHAIAKKLLAIFVPLLIVDVTLPYFGEVHGHLSGCLVTEVAGVVPPYPQTFAGRLRPHLRVVTTAPIAHLVLLSPQLPHLPYFESCFRLIHFGLREIIFGSILFYYI